MNISVGVAGSEKWPRYYIVQENGSYWDNERRQWSTDLVEATTFASMYGLKSVVSEIEEASHTEKKARYFESKCIVKVRCDDDFEIEDLQFHFAKCVNIKVSRKQPDAEDDIKDAWISVALPWSTIEETNEEEYERYE